jgi:hypothetical protein
MRSFSLPSRRGELDPEFAREKRKDVVDDHDKSARS